MGFPMCVPARSPATRTGSVQHSRLDYIFGLPGNAVVDRLVEPVADEVRVRRAQTQALAVRRYCETRYGARSWHC